MAKHDPDGPEAYGPKRHLAHLFGVELVSDIYEKLVDRGLRPLLGPERRRRLAAIRRAGLLFVHVPKNAGMSISRALYGRQIKHSRIRYYERVAPDLVRELPSFAILRDPVDRFLSAYAYGKAGGSADNQVSLPFRAAYKGFASVDAALDHLEARRFPYEVDHIFRPQSWYVLDEAGQIGVEWLFRFDRLEELGTWLAGFGIKDIGYVNRSVRPAASLTDAQVERLRRLYPDDFVLWERLVSRGG